MGFGPWEPARLRAAGWTGLARASRQQRAFPRNEGRERALPVSGALLLLKLGKRWTRRETVRSSPGGVPSPHGCQ